MGENGGILGGECQVEWICFNMELTSNNQTINFNVININGGIAVYISGEGELVCSFNLLDTSEYLAIENHSPFWCRPFWGTSLSELPRKVQALLIKNGDTYTYYLPVCDSVFKTLIRGGEKGAELYT